jgi:Nucleotidyl transferase AbiEii toxin, Type IV TA system
MLLHNAPDFGDLIAVTAREHGIDPGLVEKDYWIMHALWGLQQQGFTFELKGGTSLSKGHKLIHRFSEDIDILIEPQEPLPTGKNHTKPAHIAARRGYYESLAKTISIPGFKENVRDEAFDDEKMRSAGIRLIYPELNPLPEGVKTGILLEAGFDQVTPNVPRLISSWAWDMARDAGITELVDNRAVDVPCYEPGYTFVEKLQTISTKYRHQQETGTMPQNFLRHYYDVYCLLEDSGVQAFIGTKAYLAHKEARFPKLDEKDLTLNPAFALEDDATRGAYTAAYERTRALYYRDQPSLNAILECIGEQLARL